MAMLQVGSVAFEVSGPHYDKLKNACKGDWARQKRFGRLDALQWTGYGEASVEISGVIYPDYFPGFRAQQTFVAMMPKPQMVVSGAGDVFGLWCIVAVSNEQTYQDHLGRPGKITFDIKLERYGEDGAGDGFVGALGAAFVGRLW